MLIRSKNEYNQSLDVRVDKPQILHGSVLFLTENYLDKVNGVFPETFLYYEEEILGLVCYKLGLKMKYDSSISIYHKEDQSSELSFQNLESVKRKFARRSVRIGMKVSLMSQKHLLRRINSWTYETNLINTNKKMTLN